MMGEMNNGYYEMRYSKTAGNQLIRSATQSLGSVNEFTDDEQAVARAKQLVVLANTSDRDGYTYELDCVWKVAEGKTVQIYPPDAGRSNRRGGKQ